MAFDFSGRSFRAWDYAQAWARRCGARLEAVHVNRWTRDASGAFVSEALRDRERRAIDAALARLLPDSSRLRIVEGGDVPSQILRAARELRADLLLMATEGRTGTRSLKRPSVTEAVARLAPIPVLSLRRAARLPERIVAPIRLEPYAQKALKVAAEAAKRLGARLTLLHVKTTGETAALGRLEALSESAPPSVPVELKVREGDAIAEILAESGARDLIVLAAHRRGGPRDAVLGTTVEQVLRQAAGPVLSVPV